MPSKWCPNQHRVVACFLSLLTTASLAETTIHVGAGEPYKTIQSGINAAQKGDTVLVAPGKYDENIDFKGKAITVRSSGGSAKTILDGGGRGPAVTFKSGETAASVLSGFTIEHGGESGWVSAINDYGIGNIYIVNSAPSILANVITLGNCWDIESDSSAPAIRGNTISQTQDPDGNCSFGGGAAILVWGGLNGYNEQGVNSGVISDNIIEENVESGLEDAGGNGGAGVAVWGGTVLIMNNVIRKNASPGGSGGAINFVNSHGSAIVQNLIYGNSAGCGGGAIATDGGGLYVLNNTMVDNVGVGNAGFSNCAPIAQIYPSPDTYGSDNPSDMFINNIISGSTSYPAVNCASLDERSLSTQPTFRNNILYNAGGSFFGSYCVDVSDRDGNVAADPRFVNPAQNDYRLQNSSPAIDRGTNEALETFMSATGQIWREDLDARPRVEDGSGKGCIMDMGAYESQSKRSPCGVSEALTSSLNPAKSGQSVTLTVQLIAASGETPTGEVVFIDGGHPLSVQKISSSGSASVTTDSLSVGTHIITAVYRPTGGFGPSTARVTEVIRADTTTTE